MAWGSFSTTEFATALTSGVPNLCWHSERCQPVMLVGFRRSYKKTTLRLSLGNVVHYCRSTLRRRPFRYTNSCAKRPKHYLSSSPSCAAPPWSREKKRSVDGDPSVVHCGQRDRTSRRGSGEVVVTQKLCAFLEDPVQLGLCFELAGCRGEPEVLASRPGVSQTTTDTIVTSLLEMRVRPYPTPRVAGDRAPRQGRSSNRPTPRRG